MCWPKTTFMASRNVPPSFLMNMSGACRDFDICFTAVCLDAFWALLDNHSFLLFDVAFDHTAPAPPGRPLFPRFFFAQCLYPNAFWLLVRFTHIRHLGMHWWKVVQFWNKLTQEKRGNIVQMLKVVSELINAPNEWIKWQRIGGRMLPWELCVCCSIFECHDGGELLFHMKHTVSEWF